MPRPQRMDDVSCAICMDPLFSKLNDLDEVCHTAAPDCGHVFHEECLQQWFKAQTDAYIANARQREDRADSPTTSEAPVECPTCRTECYADEDGEPRIRRLFINFPSESQSQSLGGSSPPRPSAVERGTKIDKQLMRLSRRARGLGEEVRALGVGSEAGEVDGTLNRVERLAEDLVSVKAVQGVKTYVGGLNTALTTLRAALETHPTIPQLQLKIEEMKQTVKNVTKDMREMANITMPREKEQAVKNERVKWENKIKAIEVENGKLKHELKMEKVALKVAQKASEDKDRERGIKIKQLNTRINELEQQHKELEATLDARSKALKTYQSRAESRKELKAKNADLQNQVDRLDALLRRSPDGEPGLSRSRPGSSQQGSRRTSGTAFDQDSDNDDYHGGGGSPSKRARLSSSYSRPGEESLAIVMPSEVSLDSSPGIARPMRHPTARTIAFDGSSELLGRQKHKPKSRSKYFVTTDVAIRSESPDPKRVIQVDPESENEGNDRVLVPGSSSPVRSSPLSRPTASLSNKSINRTNPFSTTKEDSDKRKALPAPVKNAVVDLTDDTPERPRPPLVDRQAKNGSNTTVPKMTTALKRKTVIRAGQGSMVDYLGLKDANGRPKKHIATGEKAKRRA